MGANGRNQGGRPKFPAGMARDQVVRVRLTRAQLDNLREHASKEGASVSDVIRQALPAPLPRCIRCGTWRPEDSNYCGPCGEGMAGTFQRIGARYDGPKEGAI